MNPGDRPQRGLLAVLAMVAVAVRWWRSLLFSEPRAPAPRSCSPSARVRSCRAGAGRRRRRRRSWAWLTAAMRPLQQRRAPGRRPSTSPPVRPVRRTWLSRASTSSTRSTASTTRRVLVAAFGTLALVDLSTGQRLATTPVPEDARITYDPEARVAWASGSKRRGHQGHETGRGRGHPHGIRDVGDEWLARRRASHR